MADISNADLHALRATVVDTKNALEEAGGDVDKASELLREAGKKITAQGKAHRVTIVTPKKDYGRWVQERVAREIGEEVTAQLLQQALHGTNLAALGPIRKLARDMVARLPTAHSPWSDIVGPCYTSGALQRELDISRAAISRAVRERRLLRLTTSDGETLYPAFQVHNSAIVPGLGRVLRALSIGTLSTWTWAQWLNAEIVDDSGKPLPRNIERLISGQVEDVVRDAEHDAAAWAA